MLSAIPALSVFNQQPKAGLQNLGDPLDGTGSSNSLINSDKNKAQS